VHPVAQFTSCWYRHLHGVSVMTVMRGLARESARRGGCYAHPGGSCVSSSDHRGVVVGQRAGRPPDRTRRELRPRRVSSCVSGHVSRGQSGSVQRQTHLSQMIVTRSQKHGASAVLLRAATSTVFRSGGIDTVVLAGVNTSGVVLSTLSQAAELDYKILVLPLALERSPRAGCTLHPSRPPP
jgi:hypothetical protein